MPEKLRRKRFHHNRIAARYISIFFALEQLVYGLYITEKHTTIRNVYLYTALFAFLLFLTTFLSKKLENQNNFIVMDILEMIGILGGFSIPLFRLFFTRGNIDHIPTIFTAIIYGASVIFILDYWQVIVSYGLVIGSSILVVTQFLHGTYSINVIPDIIVNGSLACIIACANFRSFKLQNKASMQIKDRNDQLKILSEMDQLTGLYNRRKIDELFTSCQKGTYSTAILFDIDNFKRINDTYGHLVGDDILIELAKLVQQSVKETDYVIRWGGEEFLIMTSIRSNLAETLRKKISTHAFTNGIKISGSFGVAHCKDYENITDLLRTLDTNLYKAKENGKNCVVY